jgi:hypothetical protein
MGLEIGTLEDISGRSEILLISLIMLRSLVRFQLAPPFEKWFVSPPARLRWSALRPFIVGRTNVMRTKWIVPRGRGVMYASVVH